MCICVCVFLAIEFLETDYKVARKHIYIHKDSGVSLFGIATDWENADFAAQMPVSNTDEGISSLTMARSVTRQEAR